MVLQSDPFTEDHERTLDVLCAAGWDVIECTTSFVTALLRGHVSSILRYRTGK